MTIDELKQWCSELRFPTADLLQEPPVHILGMVKKWVADPTTQSYDVNWLGIGETARSEIYRDAENELIWDEIGALAYEYLTVTEPDNRRERLLHAMTFRMDAVLRHGSQLDGSVRDIRKLLDWALNRSLTLEQAQASLEDEGRSLEDKELFFGDLDRTRTLLKLSEAGLFERDKDLNAWAEIVEAWAHYLARPWQAERKEV